jgi:hypothetical protein
MKEKLAGEKKVGGGKKKVGGEVRLTCSGK